MTTAVHGTGQCAILLAAPMDPAVMQALEAGFTVHRLWEQAETGGFLEEIGPHIRGLATSALFGRVDDALLDKLPALEIIASFGVGYDHIDVPSALRRGIVVTHTPGVLDEEVADLTIGLLLATLRQIPQADRFLREGRWREAPFPLSPTLRGRRVGILGLGGIGKAVARRLEGFGVAIAYHGRSRQPDAAYAYHPSLIGLAAACDVLIAIVPGGADTRHLIDSEVLAALGADGVLINVSRGSVVDERALIAALESCTILAAGLDVYDDEPNVPPALLALPQLVLTPHIGSGSAATRAAMGQRVADNLLAWFTTGQPISPIPECRQEGNSTAAAQLERRARASHLAPSPELETKLSRPKLFEPFHLGQLTLANRIVIAPMCQYSAIDGCMTDWHMIHLGHLALSGAALLTIEATAVVPEGRISYADVGLWDDATEAAMERTLASIRHYSAMPIAIQLAHAGRKASTDLPWSGGRQLPPGAEHGWQTVAPSPSAFAPDENPPLALSRTAMDDICQAFVAATRRAARLGIDAVQIHAAHGYLLHQFLSPLANHRDDAYGGSLENRMRFPLEVFAAVREAWPADKPLTMRVSGTDWVPGGWDIAQTVEFAKALEARGCSAIHVSSGGLDPRQHIPVGPNYQVPLARAVKQAVAMPVIAVGMITDFEQAEAIVGTGDADMIALARAMLYDPRWPWHAAAHLGAQVQAPPQYLRSQPRQYKDLFGLSEG